MCGPRRAALPTAGIAGKAINFLERFPKRCECHAECAHGELLHLRKNEESAKSLGATTSSTTVLDYVID